MTSNLDKISVAAASVAARKRRSYRTTFYSRSGSRSCSTRCRPTRRLWPNPGSSRLKKHRALGYRPPPGSLAAQAQSAAAHHTQFDPVGTNERGTQRTSALKEAARIDAARIAAEKGEAVGSIPTVGLDEISKEETARLQSAEHKILGHRPPPGSLAVQAQSAADRNAQGQNRIKGEGPGGADLNTIGQEDANQLMSEEHKRLGHRPPADSLAAQAQAAVSAR